MKKANLEANVGALSVKLSEEEMQELLSAIPSEAVSGTRVSAAMLAQCKYSSPFILEGCYSHTRLQELSFCQ
jgi:hypothetical protein